MNIPSGIGELSQNIEKIIIGKTSEIQMVLITLLCGGHLLLEDVPGLGKTMLARSIAASLDLDFKRIQFTPDLLPTDVTGVSIYNQKTGEFEFRPGPIFTNILLADEINRTTPRTQSSLLEAMEERQVTVDGQSHLLPQTFMAIATQNPIELQGTYPLPEAQLDRFFMRIKMGYPTVDQEVSIMEQQIKGHPIRNLTPVTTGKDLENLQDLVKNIFIEGSVKRYIAEIMEATRKHPHLTLGASPRGSLALMRASQGMAVVKGTDFVEPSYVKELAGAILGHRLIVKPQSRLQGITPEKVIEEILTAIPVPVHS